MQNHIKDCQQGHKFPVAAESVYSSIILLLRERFVRRRVWFLLIIYLFRSEHCPMRTLVQRICFGGLKLFTGASTEATPS